MNKKEKIIEQLSKELTEKKTTRINIRVTDDLYKKLINYKRKSGANISDIIRISLMNYFIENEVNN
jgi:hypothetical protein